MTVRIPPEEILRFARHWDPKVAEIVQERMRTNYSRDPLQHFSPEEATTMSAFLARLIPESEGVDLVGWMDRAVGEPLGRGDWRPDMPSEEELYHAGLRLLDEFARARDGQTFAALTNVRQDEFITALQAGNPPHGEVGRYFFHRFYEKALHGYFAHPRVWMRIGFYGPSYPEGYLWLDRNGVRRRHARAPGWDTL
jgi:hypothetical protein